jgi:hypothetical protein
MSQIAARPNTRRTDIGHLIEVLSERLQIPADKVHQTYREELNRLSAQARIPDFLPLLALRNAREILRGGAHRKGTGIRRSPSPRGSESS